MRAGKSLTELAQELETMKETARDFVVPTEKLEAVPSFRRTKNSDSWAGDTKVELAFENQELQNSFRLNRHSGNQVASYTNIPTQYFNRIAEENPTLAAQNINHGLQTIAAQDRKRGVAARMLRTVEQNGVPTVRGFVSDKYRRLDSYDLLETVFPTFQKHGLQVASSEITDQRMYLKVLSPKLRTEVKTGDPVQYGLVISNSDVGAGSVRIEPLIYRLVCQNGMISNTSMKKYHVGRSQADQEIYELLTDETRDLDERAFWAKCVDLIEGSLNQERFEMDVDKLRRAANLEIKSDDPARVVELAMRATGITGEGKKSSIIAALASGNEGAGYTQYGLVNSFTRAAHQNQNLSYEDSVEMERAAGKIIELKESQWKQIAAVA